MVCTGDAPPPPKILFVRRDPGGWQFQVLRLTQPKIHLREHVVMAWNCEPEVREHVTIRMRRRAEIQNCKAEAGHPTPVARAIPPHYAKIQNMRFQLKERSNGLNLPAPRRPASPSETVQGSHYINHEFVRLDITEHQPYVFFFPYGCSFLTVAAPGRCNYSWVLVSWTLPPTPRWTTLSSGCRTVSLLMRPDTANGPFRQVSWARCRSNRANPRQHLNSARQPAHHHRKVVGTGGVL